MAGFVFHNYNGIYQLKLETAQDLELIHELEEPRWAATSAPLDQLFCDPKFLQYVDTDGNSRIRVNELKEAHRWLCAQLRDLSGVTARSDVLMLAHLDPALPEAARMKSLAERMVRERSSLRAADEISLEEVRGFRDSYARRFPNGDGVVTEAQVEDAELKPLVQHVLKVTGGAKDLSDAMGVRNADLDAFLELGKKFLAWQAESEGVKEGECNALEPLGPMTAEAAEVVKELDGKMEQFFAQCQLLAADDAAATRLTTTAESMAAVDVTNPLAIRAWLEQAPLSKPNRECVLDLDGTLNPHFAGVLRNLRDHVLPNLKSPAGAPSARVDAAQWAALRETVKPYREWQARKPTGLPEGMSAQHWRELVEGPLPQRLRTLLTADERASDELRELNSLEKLVLYQRWLLELANNFVSFPYLFTAGQRSLFETGTLILDGRALLLCVRVMDRPGHKTVAEGSQMFVVYVELNRKEGETDRTMEVAAVVTAGTRQGIAVGKRGVFYDRDGKEWDARVVELIVAPISLLEAALGPLLRIKNYIGERLHKLTSSKLDSLQQSVTKRVDKTAPPPVPPPPPPPAAAPAVAGQPMSSLLLGGGVAFAALGSAMAFVMKTLSDIRVMQVLLTVLGIIGLIVGISALLGWLKLRKRDLSTVLEACGWALNGRMYLTRRLSLLYTQEPDLPEGSRIERPRMVSRYVAASERKRRRRWLLWTLLGLLCGAVAAGIYFDAELLEWWTAFTNPPCPVDSPPQP